MLHRCECDFNIDSILSNWQSGLPLIGCCHCLRSGLPTHILLLLMCGETRCAEWSWTSRANDAVMYILQKGIENSVRNNNRELLVFRTVFSGGSTDQMHHFDGTNKAWSLEVSLCSLLWLRSNTWNRYYQAILKDIPWWYYAFSWAWYL
jgi:hypothetical protein